MGSSPAGKSGLFYEIGANQDNNYSEYIRLHVNWWDIPVFCKDVPKARELALGMITDQRVSMFGTDQIKSIRRSMLLEEFQQEYECAYLDESYSYFPWDMIMKCVPIYGRDDETVDFDAPGSDLSEHDKLGSGKGVEFFHGDGAFDEFMKAIQSGKIKGGILGGYDVARSQDGSEVIFLEEDNNHMHTVRCNVELKKMPLPEQRTLITSMFKALGRRLLKFGVDYNGIGCNIAEDLQAISYDTVVCLPFNNNAWKEEATRKLRYRMEMGQLQLPTNRPLLNQIHSIKRILLPGGQWRFDTVENAKHHGDKYWALIAASDVGYAILDSASMSYDLDPRVMPKENKKRPKGIIQPKRVSVMPVFAISGGRLNPYSNIPGMSMSNLPAPRMPAGLMPSRSDGFEFPI
jgi:hypothetical protein